MNITAVTQAAAEAFTYHRTEHTLATVSGLCSCGALCADFQDAQQHRTARALMSCEPPARELVADLMTAHLEDQRLSTEVDRIARTFPAAGLMAGNRTDTHHLVLEEMCSCGALAGDSHLALAAARQAVAHVHNQVLRAIRGHSNFLEDVGDQEGATTLNELLAATTPMTENGIVCQSTY